MNRFTRTCLFAALLAAFAGCGGSEAAKDEGGSAATAAIPDAFWLEKAPQGAVEVGAARADAVDGAEITVHGKISTFVDGRAAFNLVDLAMLDCTQRPGDTCKTPWDYCCHSSEELAANTITIEFRGPEGLLRRSAEGFHGIGHLSKVAIRGKARRDASGNLLVVAEVIGPE